MLDSNVAAYQQLAQGSWSETRNLLARCPVFKSAELQFPYNSNHPAYVSLADSADHDHYQLVSLAVPVTDNAHGDTKALRAHLGLPTQPTTGHVVDHLLKLVATTGVEEILKLSSHPLNGFVLDGIKKGYQHIISHSNKHSCLADLNVNSRLAQEPWVLVKNGKFVRPCDLCFDLEGDTPSGI